MKRRNFLKTAAVAAATSPLWLASYGCKEKEVLGGQTEVDPILVSKLETILNNVNSRLLKKEIPTTEYDDFIFEQLKSQGLLSGDIYGNASGRDFIKVQIDERLSTQRIFGLDNDYIVLESTSYSQKAKDDINAYKWFKAEVRSILQDLMGSKEVSQFKYESIIETCANGNLQSVRPSRRITVRCNLVEDLESEFNIRKSHEYIGDKYTREDVRKALEKAIVR